MPTWLFWRLGSQRLLSHEIHRDGREGFCQRLAGGGVPPAGSWSCRREKHENHDFPRATASMALGLVAGSLKEGREAHAGPFPAGFRAVLRIRVKSMEAGRGVIAIHFQKDQNGGEEKKSASEAQSGAFSGAVCWKRQEGVAIRPRGIHRACPRGRRGSESCTPCCCCCSLNLSASRPMTSGGMAWNLRFPRRLLPSDSSSPPPPARRTPSRTSREAQN